MNVRQGWFTLLVLCINGCAVVEPTQQAQRILPAYPEMVTDCAFLGAVTGDSAMPFLPTSEQIAKFRALDDAADLGATHIVWVATTNGLRPSAQGRAYYCDPDRNMPNSYRYIDQYLRIHRYPYDGFKR